MPLDDQTLLHRQRAFEVIGRQLDEIAAGKVLVTHDTATSLK